MKHLLVALSIVGLSACQAGLRAAAPASGPTPAVSQTDTGPGPELHPFEGDVPRLKAGDDASSAAAASAVSSAPMSQEARVEACRTTDPSRCEKVGLDYVAAAKEASDHAAYFYGRGCDNSDVASCTRLGTMLMNGEGVDKDWVAAVQAFERACALSDGTECSNLGLAYEFGNGVLRDTRRAAQLFDRACRRGSASGCSNLATAYMKGLGVRRDRKHAIFLYKGACSDGDPLGCFNLGVIYATGQGVARDPSQAVSYYRSACNRSHGEACGNLGQLRQAGRGIGVRDPRSAIPIFLRGCGLGDAESCLYLGLAYQAGDGVAANARDARRYLWLALALNPKLPAAQRALVGIERGAEDEHALPPVGTQPRGE
ncbi:sel1 repeat family protein [Burkholderia cepacia]|uniref:tetratricopeptide repeat protein n=1 Tax=Burkholderia cepacia TaxID=292 RepID=UPI00249E3F79|nr:tetratricopeptide repeat protein [Burkholderia cepacia]WGY71679.1 sel1 repeat family protein [Burkholderia cepacia]